MPRGLQVPFPFLFGLAVGAFAGYAMLKKPKAIGAQPVPGRAWIDALVRKIKAGYRDSMKKGL
jgi:hypothetical protein